MRGRGTAAVKTATIRSERALTFGEPLSFDPESRVGFDWRGVRVEHGAIVLDGATEGYVLDLRAKGKSFEALVRPLRSLVADRAGEPRWIPSRRCVVLHQSTEADEVAAALGLDLSAPHTTRRSPRIDRRGTAYDWRGHPLTVGATVAYRSSGYWEIAVVQEVAVLPSSSSSSRPFTLTITNEDGRRPRTITAVEVVTVLAPLPPGLSCEEGHERADSRDWYEDRPRRLDDRGLPFNVDTPLLFWRSGPCVGSYRQMSRPWKTSVALVVNCTLRNGCELAGAGSEERICPDDGEQFFVLPLVPEVDDGSTPSALESLVSELGLAV